MAGIFISYRRDDAPGHAGRIYDRLAARFGKDSVFLDVEAIEAGSDFVETIERAIDRCDAVVAIIGPGWATAVDSAGRRRLDDARDFVRLEIAHALRRRIRVLPVLVERARLPRDGELPAELAPLLRRHALAVRDERWDADVQALIESLQTNVSPAPTARSRPAAGQTRFGPRRAAAIGAVAVVAAVTAGTIALMRPVATPQEAGPPAGARPEPAGVTPAAQAGLGILWLGVRSDGRSESPPGVRVSHVYPGGPAAGAGLTVGDVLVEVNGTRIAHFGDLQNAVTTAVNDSPGRSSEVALVRDGRMMRVAVVFDRSFRPKP